MDSNVRLSPRVLRCLWGRGTLPMHDLGGGDFSACKCQSSSAVYFAGCPNLGRCFLQWMRNAENWMNKSFVCVRSTKTQLSLSQFVLSRKYMTKTSWLRGQRQSVFQTWMTSLLAFMHTWHIHCVTIAIMIHFPTSWWAISAYSSTLFLPWLPKSLKNSSDKHYRLSLSV